MPDAKKLRSVLERNVNLWEITGRMEQKLRNYTKNSFGFIFL